MVFSAIQSELQHCALKEKIAPFVWAEILRNTIKGEEEVK